MKISDLSKESGIPVPTIKYYLREGLVQPGIRTGPNQADYDEDHVHRLRLVRTLADVGGLPLATIHDVLSALADPSLPLHDVLGIAHHALGPDLNDDEHPEETERSRVDVDRFLADLGWRVDIETPARRELAAALAALRALGWHVDARVFDRYARVAERLAAWELRQTPSGADRAGTVEAVVVGTVVFESALVALRRLAQEHHSATRFNADAATAGAPPRPS